MSQWVNGKVQALNWHTERLFTLTVKADTAPFTAGQFTKLALDVDDGHLARAYSFVNPPNSPYHEFLIVHVPKGRLSEKLIRLNLGDDIDVYRSPSGYFTLDEVPDAKVLWLFATGTGIGPFISILREGTLWQRFPKVVLVHGVRRREDLLYQTLFGEIQAQGHAFKYVSVVSREANPHGLIGRIPHLIENGELENQVGVVMEKDHHMMLCGNPDMVKDGVKVLTAKGFQKHRRQSPGQITVEQYW